MSTFFEEQANSFLMAVGETAIKATDKQVLPSKLLAELLERIYDRGKWEGVRIAEQMTRGLRDSFSILDRQLKELEKKLNR